MLTAFFFCFKDQSALREGHERQRYLDYQDYQVLYLNLFRSSHQRCSTGVRKLKRCSQKFLTKFTRKTPVLESLFQILLKKRLWHLFSCEFCEISKNTFFTEHPFHLLILQSWRLLLLFIDLSLTFLSPLCSQLQVPYTQCVCFTTQLFLMIAVAIFPVFYVLFLKLNLFPALHMCSVLPFLLPTERCLLDCVIDRKVRDIIFEAILSPSEHATRIFRIQPAFQQSTFFETKISDNGKHKKHATNKIRSSRPEVFCK